jgi:predicted N-acetyltransferase YhbS/SAM-dependent methyltransferase
MTPAIRMLSSAEEMEPVRVLFREYAASLGFDLCFQNFEQELADLPGRHAPPSGCLLLATAGDEPAGCVALKELADGVGEMKRLYVRSRYRGAGLGRTLAGQIIGAARRLGYRAIRLDTIPSVMGSAVALYRSLGFRDIPASCSNPVPGASFMELQMNVTVRADTPGDLEAVREVNRHAFGQEDEARLVDALRDGGYARLSLVAEEGGRVVGHILFSDLPIVTQAGTLHGLALAPVAVLPERQRQGVGSRLVREGHRVVVVLGHPRFGFSARLAGRLEAPFSGPAFMALELVPGALAGVEGVVQYPPPFGLESARWFAEKAMSDKPEEQRRLTLDQFTRQAVPFAEMPAHSNDEANRLLIDTAHVAPEDDVLDVACGPGLVACTLAEVARHVTGLDLTPAMIEQARARQQARGLTNLTWLVGDAVPLPFPDAAFSVVVTRYSLHHFLDPQAVLAEMVRVCQPGGRVAVIDVFTSSPEQAEAYNRVEKLRDPSHVRALSLEELIGLCDHAGLRHVKAAFFKLGMALETLLAASFPNPGDADRIRQAFADDIGVDRLGVGAHRRDGAIHFAFPIVVIVGKLERPRVGVHPPRQPLTPGM